MTVATFIPYCGVSPVPGTVSCNMDPTLIVFLLAAPALYIVKCARNEPLAHNKAGYLRRAG